MAELNSSSEPTATGYSNEETEPIKNRVVRDVNEEDYKTPSNEAVAGGWVGWGIRALGRWAEKVIFRACAFLGGAAKSFLFGNPDATKNFWDDLRGWMDARSYPASKQSESNDQKDKKEDSQKETQTTEKTQKSKEGEKKPTGGEQDKNKNGSIPTDETVPNPSTGLKDGVIDKEKSQQINRELIRYGLGCTQISTDEFSLASIDEKGNATSGLYSVRAEAFHESGGVNNPESLATAIFRLKYANDPKVMESNESFDNAVIQSTIEAAIISAELSGDTKDSHHVEGVMKTTMGELGYSVHTTKGASYSVDIAGKTYTISSVGAAFRDDFSIQARVSELVNQFRQDPPQCSFTITKREGKEIRVDHELGTSKCYVQVIIDGEVKHEDAYDACESPKTYGKHDATKTLADLIQDMGRGNRSLVPEWTKRDSEADKTSQWISPAAVAYTIAGIVNPGMTPSISKDDPNQFYSLIHAGRRSGPDYINANMAHMAIDFSNGFPRYVSNHGECGYIYTPIDYKNPTETAQNLEELRRVIIDKDPSENFPILSPNESKSPIDSIVERMESFSRQENNQIAQSIALRQISIDCAEIINASHESAEINNTVNEPVTVSKPAASIDINEAIRGLSFAAEENDETQIGEDGWTEGMDEETRAVYEQVVNEVEIG